MSESRATEFPATEFQRLWDLCAGVSCSWTLPLANCAALVTFQTRLVVRVRFTQNLHSLGP